MIVEYVRYQIDPSQSADFESAYAEAAHSLDHSSHCQAYELARCEEDPNSYILRIEWDSTEGHLQGFRRSPEFGSFFQAIRPYVQQIQEMRHYRISKVARRKAQAVVA
jgi:quinol monooxygenase YgiN